MAADPRSPNSELIAQAVARGTQAPGDAPRRDATEDRDDTGEPDVTEDEEDVVTEASIQSFPASDPPGWIPVRL